MPPPPSRWSAGPCALLLLTAGSLVSAEELRLGLQSDYVFNSNFLSSDGTEDEANSFLLGPIVQLTDDEGRFVYDVDFQGGYQVFVDQSGVDAWESRLDARLTYEIDSRTSLRLTDRFRDISNLRFSRQDISLGITALDPIRNRYFRNDVELELIRDLSRRLELRVGAGHQWIDFEDDDERNDSQSFEGSTEVRYAVTRTQQLGLGTTYVYQDFEPSLRRLGSRAQYVNGFLSWNWQISSEISFSANGGPSWVRSKDDDTDDVSRDRFVGGDIDGDLFRADFDSCDGALASRCDFATPGTAPIPADDLGGSRSFDLTGGDRVGSASELTFFGGASLQAALTDWTLQLSYSRRQSSTAGDALASTLDRVALDVEYAPARRRWAVYVAGSWDRRETLTEATAVDFTVIEAPDGSAERQTAFTEIDSDRSRRDNFTVLAGFRQRLNRNLSGSLEARYRRSEVEERGVTRGGIDTWFVVVSVEYIHDAIRR